MKVYKHKNFSTYKKIQIDRSNIKFKYNKVSIKEVIFFRKIINLYNCEIKNILCLGSRNAIEVDYFKKIFFSNIFISYLFRFTEIKTRLGFFPLLNFFLKFNRSNKKSFAKNKFNVLGNDINPTSQRKDIIICSFDKFEEKYHNQFDLIYSNSFDQSFDPHKSLKEWDKLLKKNGFLILGFPTTQPTISDPTGDISITDLTNMVNYKLIYYSENFTYNYAIFKK